MLHVLLVGTGGFIGSVLRFLVSAALHETSVRNGFPFGTLAVNLIGCLLIGFLAGMGETGKWFTQEVRLFIFIGLLGGFTTFSSFGLDTVNLLRNGSLVQAAVNVTVHAVLGISAVRGGLFLAKIFPGL